jgi:hypothetical protein
MSESPSRFNPKVNTFSNLILLFSVAFVLAIAIIWAVMKISQSTNTVKVPTCTVDSKLGEICPDENWVNTYKDYKQLQDDITKLASSDSAKELRKKIDESTGIATRLNNSVPPGYSFDEKGFKFVPRVSPVAPTPEKK